jgi:hypothetical protein
LDASSAPEKQRACSALDAVSLGTGCILHRQEVEKKEMVISPKSVAEFILNF